MNARMTRMQQKYAERAGGQLKKGQHGVRWSVTSPAGDPSTACLAQIWSGAVLPHCSLSFFDIHTDALPGEAATTDAEPLWHAEFCLDGRLELQMDDGACLYLKPNDYFVGRQISQGVVAFPSRLYRGLSLYFEPAFFDDDAQPWAAPLGLSTSALRCRLLPQGMLQESSDSLRQLLTLLWRAYEEEDIFHMRLGVLALLHHLQEMPTTASARPPVYYTGVQVAIAKKAEAILTANLSQHIPIRTLAAQFGVSETSLKNYFRGVYGRTVSEHLHLLRMQTAARLLRETSFSVGDIAARVGYTKQGRFAEVFRKTYGQNPLAWRRSQTLQRLDVSSQDPR